ncbi:hypothetical protein HQ590_15535 [bacterium]|nr:hypothetical protein [bacterium]
MGIIIGHLTGRINAFVGHPSTRAHLDRATGAWVFMRDAGARARLQR